VLTVALSYPECHSGSCSGEEGRGGGMRFDVEGEEICKSLLVLFVAIFI